MSSSALNVRPRSWTIAFSTTTPAKRLHCFGRPSFSAFLILYSDSLWYRVHLQFSEKRSNSAYFIQCMLGLVSFCSSFLFPRVALCILASLSQREMVSLRFWSNLMQFPPLLVQEYVSTFCWGPSLCSLLADARRRRASSKRMRDVRNVIRRVIGRTNANLRAFHTPPGPHEPKCWRSQSSRSFK